MLIGLVNFHILVGHPISYIIVTQIASLLAVATVFIDLWTPFSQGGGGLMREGGA